jgi:5-methylcytosine-specific restriction endonuclease McrA
VNWTHEQLSAIWAKASVVPSNDPNVWRQDACGAWIGWRFHGNRESQYGWEVDHITPVEYGGSDAISNLRPLHWKNNASKQDGRLTCRARANGTGNIGV